MATNNSILVRAHIAVHTVLNLPEGYMPDDIANMTTKYSTMFVEMKDGKTFKFEDTEVLAFEEHNTAFKNAYNISVIECALGDDNQDYYDDFSYTCGEEC